MHPHHLKRVFDIVRSTSEHVIVADAKHDQVYVVMPYEEYEALIGLVEDGREHVSDAHAPEPKDSITFSETIDEPQSLPIVPPTRTHSSVAEQPKTRTSATASRSETDRLEFADEAWDADWEREFMAEHLEEEMPEEEENEEEKFYIEPLI